MTTQFKQEQEQEVPLLNFSLFCVSLFAAHEVDGTREFVEGRLGAVQCLIGIAYRGRPVAGVIGLPFREELMVVGVAGSPSGVLWMGLNQQSPAASSSEGQIRLSISADLGKGTPALETAVQVLQNHGSVEMLKAGGCGNKVLQLLKGQSDIAIFNLKCSRWDTCATQAVLESSGGTMTTLFGWPLEHSMRHDATYTNTLGVIASTCRFKGLHASLCKTLAAEVQVCRLLGSDVPQAFDVARRIDGDPLQVSDLQRIIYSETLSGAPKIIEKIWSSDSEAVRYKQSHAVRIHWQLKDGARHSAFFKRIVMRELPHAVKKITEAPYKLKRDIKANRTEAALLTSPLALSFNKKYAGIFEIVTAYDIQSRVFSGPPRAEPPPLPIPSSPRPTVPNYL
jgi:fructose-1,6-bisphosphatase/inositol monophosphatase family enzyme